DQDAADDPDHRRRAPDQTGVFRHVTLPVGAGQNETLRMSSGGAAAEMTERVCVGIEKAQDVVAVICVWHAQQKRACRQVNPEARIECVVVWRDHPALSGLEKPARVSES